MSKLEKLIQQYCPDGVEWIKIKDIAQVGTGSSNGNEADEDGKYPFFVRSQIVKSKNDFEYDEEAIIIPGEGGIGDIFHYINGKYALHQRVYRIHFTTQQINVKFAFYYMKSAFKRFIMTKAVSATVTSIRKPMIEDFEIPVPPLPVQEEIVRILDTFTELQAELQAELQKRKQQYNYYRDNLLTNFTNEREPKEYTLEKATIDIYSGATPSKEKKDYWENGTIPWMSSGEVNLGQVYEVEGRITQLGYDKCSTKMVPEGSVVIALAGQGKTRGTVAILRTSVCTNQSLAALIPNTKIVSGEYLYHYLKTQYSKLREVSAGDGTRGGLNLKMLRAYKVVIPPLAEQNRIVAILDRFDTLTNDLTSGLPAEIEKRRQQYEYYRDKLLTFKRKGA